MAPGTEINLGSHSGQVCLENSIGQAFNGRQGRPEIPPFTSFFWDISLVVPPGKIISTPVAPFRIESDDNKE